MCCSIPVSGAAAPSCRALWSNLPGLYNMLQLLLVSPPNTLSSVGWKRAPRNTLPFIPVTLHTMLICKRLGLSLHSKSLHTSSSRGLYRARAANSAELTLRAPCKPFQISVVKCVPQRAQGAPQASPSGALLQVRQCWAAPWCKADKATLPTAAPSALLPLKPEIQVFQQQ